MRASKIIVKSRFLLFVLFHYCSNFATMATHLALSDQLEKANYGYWFFSAQFCHALFKINMKKKKERQLWRRGTRDKGWRAAGSYDRGELIQLESESRPFAIWGVCPMQLGGRASVLAFQYIMFDTCHWMAIAIRDFGRLTWSPGPPKNKTIGG